MRAVDMNNLIQTVLIYALPVLFAITIHEAAHGYVARALGDNTAAALGRVTLNPLKHVDLMGTVLMPLLLYFATGGAFLFGYAKPVPVNFARLRHPKRDMVWVQAILWAIAYTLLVGGGMNERFFLEMCKAGVLVNLVMWAFNLFPLPPLDGGRVAVGLLPHRMAWSFSRIEPWGFYIVMALVLVGIVSRWWLRPLIEIGYRSLDFLLTPLTALFT
jgi:Zn-dependent protease